MKRVKKTPLTAEQFEVIGHVGDWQCNDIPRQDWGKIPGLERVPDTIAVMGSASIADMKTLNGIQAVAGTDLLAHEPHPKMNTGETDGNAYHYVVQKINRADYPYILHGPFRCEMLVKHWFTADELTAYDNLP
jgi:hypothetical protein